jgi:pimeloyl-ACP methyl ester carboxylesterase
MLTTRVFEDGGHRIVARVHELERAGTPLVFLHGICTSLDMWEPLLPPQDLDGPWLSLSLPGHAPGHLALDTQRTDMTPRWFADQLGAALETWLGERRALLVGWSTGGYAALAMAVHRPWQVAGVVSVAGFCKGKWTGPLGLGQQQAQGGWAGQLMFRASTGLLLSRRKLLELSYRISSARTATFDTPEVQGIVDRIHRHARVHDLRSLCEMFAALRGTELDVTGIDAPVWVAGGDQDATIPIAHTIDLAAKVPGAELEVWPRTGHMFFAEQPDAFRALCCRAVEHVTRSSKRPVSPSQARSPAGSICSRSTATGPSTSLPIRVD